MRALGQLVAGIAHELRNPLAGILGLTEAVIEVGKVEGEDREDLVQVHKLSLRCKDIVDNLLRFARKERLEKAQVTIPDLLDQALGLLQHQVRASGVELIKDLASDLPPVMANHNQLVQVLF